MEYCVGSALFHVTHECSSLHSMLNQNPQFMTEFDIADKILGLLIGGHDTASAACTFVVKYLAELPHIYDKVYQ
ncbi:unnamed protein product, partial [Sphenostylis stenocarpa]